MQCEKALILDSLKLSEFHSNDYRLSILVDERLYEEAQRSASASAVIYGVPFEQSYSDYSAKAQELRSRYENTYSTEDAMSVAWSGLSKNSAEAYKACLESHNIMQGLTLELQDATDEQVVLRLHWRKGIGGPEKIQLEWQGGDAITGLPSVADNSPDGVPIVINRPSTGKYFLIVQGIHEGAHILGDHVLIAAVTPLIEKPRPPRTIATWSAKIKNSIIDERLPLEALGRAVRFKLAARANSRVGGWISARVEIDGNQVFATQQYSGADNPMLPAGLMSDEIDIPLNARRALIEFNNGGAEAAWGLAELIG